MSQSSVVGFIAGCVVAGGAVYLLVRSIPTEPRPETVSSSVPVTDTSRDDSQILERLDRLERKVDELQATLRLEKARPSEPVPKSSADRAPEPQASAVATESDPFALVPDLELLEQVKAILQTREGVKDVAGALRRMESLLGRSLSPENRADALLQQGMLYRLKRDRAREEQAFRDALAQQDITTPLGQWATNQLAWTNVDQEHYEVALELFDSVVRQPTVNAMLKAACRWDVIRNAERLGWRDRARLELESFVNDYGNETAAWLADDVRQAREKLEKLR